MAAAGRGCYGRLSILLYYPNMAIVMEESEPLARHAVFKIGGPARFFVAAKSAKDVAAGVQLARERGAPWVMLGAGSNVLVSDQGFPGVVIHPAAGRIRVTGTELIADAGAPMARAVAAAAQAGLTGFEWAIGVPGTIGGSVFGNAGCFGSEMQDVVSSVAVFNALTGATESWPGSEARFSYRDSIFKRRPELVILSATLALRPGDSASGQRLIREHTARRAEAQDIGTHSAGCMFKNIPWTRRDVDPERLLERHPELVPFRQNPAIPAGFLIDQVGLKGRAIGRAKVSERHGNFFLNTGGATAEEVVMLAGLAKERVHRRYGLLLEEEIRYVGFE